MRQTLKEIEVNYVANTACDRHNFVLGLVLGAGNIHDSQMFIEASPSAPMSSVVKVYELLGAEVFLYFDVDGTQVTARVDPRTTAKTGDPIKFAFDMEKSHFFDKETELTICN